MRSSKRGGPLSVKLVIIIIAVIILGLLVSSYWFLFKRGPEQVVQRYLMAYLEEDLAAVQSLQTSASAGLLLQIPEFQSLDVGKAQIQGDTATVPVIIKGGVLPGLSLGPREDTIGVLLVKEDGQWKVDLMGMLRRQRPRQPGFLPGGLGLPAP